MVKYLNKRWLILLVVITLAKVAYAQDPHFDLVTKQNHVSIIYDSAECKLNSIVAHLLAKDIESVTGYLPQVQTNLALAKGNVILIGSIGSGLIKNFPGSYAAALNGKWECYAFKVLDKPSNNIQQALIISGSDFRGTAYGVFSLSEKIGVSPWYWWADVQAKKQQELSISQADFISSPPAVKYRGIFINDEDWGLQPWAAKTFEPETNDIGPKTYAKVFELLLRLKANLIWPAMHPSTKAFFHYPGNIKTAEDFQIIIGSSHAEPMLRNNVGEWDEKAMGHFNYLTNKDSVYKYWEDRVKETKGINAIYSMGMRGVHDSGIEGVKSADEAVPVLEQIFKDQRHLLANYVNKEVTAIPQALTIYKEVLDIYDKGLKVPDDITLVWPDDNYGYIQRLNNEKEQQRSGGSGVYYHASYWGRPHDYLWLSSTHPALIQEEMMKAYNTGADRLWVLNVGDIKPLEYNIQLFLDMAFNPLPFKESSYTKQHLLQWVTDIFGKEKSKNIQSILWKYYQLAFERRPEFMGWSQTEPTTKTNYTAYNHFYFGDEAQQRIDQYNALETAVKKMRPQINDNNAATFYELVYYPVVCASWMNKKFLYRDKSYYYTQQNRLSALNYAKLSKACYDSIVKETAYYNTALAGGKWMNIMSMKPRGLPVYQAPVLPAIKIDQTDVWNVIPEGYITKYSSLVSEANAMLLPAFDNIGKQRYFIDIFLSKNETIQWTAKVSDNSIRLSKNNGLLNATNNQQRIWVHIDWDKLTTNRNLTDTITFTVAGKQKMINLQMATINNPALENYTGFVEQNGFVDIHAANFTKQNTGSLNSWQLVDGIGYTDHSIQAVPLSLNSEVFADTNTMTTNDAFVVYDFYSFSEATPIVSVFGLPTHPINNNYSVRYALSIDDGPLQIVDIKTTGRSEQWKQDVLSNRAERKIAMPFINPGEHTLKMYAIDPGVIIDEIRIDLGGLKQAYSVLPETKAR
ncbi:glycosyl hydrolase 115 family protein [soil metagenome]